MGLSTGGAAPLLVTVVLPRPGPGICGERVGGPGETSGLGNVEEEEEMEVVAVFSPPSVGLKAQP